MITGEQVIGVSLLGAFAATMWFAVPPAGTLNGQEAIQSTAYFHLIRKTDEVDGTLTVVHKASGDKLTIGYLDRTMYRDKKHDSTWETSVARDRYLVDPRLDLGAWAGLVTNPSNDLPAFDAGLRVGAARLLYGTVSPDLLISGYRAGIGLSIYPPPDYLGHLWNHVGIGAGYTWAYADGDPSPVIYLSTSIRF
jgi:hypothetical protein